MIFLFCSRSVVGFCHIYGSSHMFRSVKGFNRSLSIRVIHLDETITT